MMRASAQEEAQGTDPRQYPKGNWLTSCGRRCISTGMDPRNRFPGTPYESLIAWEEHLNTYSANCNKLKSFQKKKAPTHIDLCIKYILINCKIPSLLIQGAAVFV